MKVTLIAGAMLAALVLASCGGHSDKKANEAYATNVCTAISGWEQQITAIATDFSGGISKSSLEAKATKMESATTDLVNQIKTIAPPDTDDGKAAKQQLDSLSLDLSTTTTAVKTVVAQLGDNPSAANVAAAVLTLAPQVKNLAGTAKNTVAALRNAGGGVSSAFKSSSECKNLT